MGTAARARSRPSRFYYTPEHIKTILRRAKASGMGIFYLMQTILWFSQSPEIERVHPLQGGLLRFKRRSERRRRCRSSPFGGSTPT